MLYGEDAFDRLQHALVAVIGLGGVGGCAAETLVRAGVGRIRIVDCDVIKPTDTNRQIIALADTVRVPKVEAMKARLLAINPSLSVDARNAFFHRDTAAELITKDLAFVVDAIDSLNPKGELVRCCTDSKIPIVSAMGAAGRTDPFQVRVDRLESTVNCPLARALRRHLRAKGITTDIPVVYSVQRPVAGSGSVFPEAETEGTYLRGRHRSSLPSFPVIPAMFGLLAAHYVLSGLLGGTTPGFPAIIDIGAGKVPEKDSR